MTKEKLLKLIKKLKDNASKLINGYSKENDCKGFQLQYGRWNAFDLIEMCLEDEDVFKEICAIYKIK